MKSQDLKKFKLPDTPGVYLFKRKLSHLGVRLLSGGREEVLYIGKATSLKDRVRSYFAKDIAFVRSLLIEKMVEKATKIDWIETDSVLEALILEANLIKKYKPTHNTREKDDKSFSFVGITKEEYPRVFAVRGKDLQTKFDIKKDFKYIFGPYPAGGSLKEALKIVRKIFPFRGEKSRKSILNEQIGIEPGKEITKKEYEKTIKNIKLFFEGKSSQVLKNLRTEMEKLAKKQEFERAQRIKRQIFALGHINDIALIKEEKLYGGNSSVKRYRVEAYDVAHTGEKNRVGVMVVIEDGEPKKSAYRKFNIHPHTNFAAADKKSASQSGSSKISVRVKKSNAGDTDALEEILERRLGHPEWQLPKLIVVDGGKAQKNTAEKTLTKFGYQIPVVAVVKGKGHKAKNILGTKTIISKKESEILLANSESHRFALRFHREKRKI